MQVQTAQPVIQEEKQVKSKFIPNPRGVGGFADHPEIINRNGRPKRDWTFKSLIEDAMEEIAPNEEGGLLKRKRILVNKLVKLAWNNDLKAMVEIMDRVDGKSEQKHEVTLNPKPLDDIPDRVIEGRIV